MEQFLCFLMLYTLPVFVYSHLFLCVYVLVFLIQDGRCEIQTIIKQSLLVRAYIYVYRSNLLLRLAALLPK